MSELLTMQAEISLVSHYPLHAVGRLDTENA